MAKVKHFLTSERGMKIANAAFLLMVLILNVGTRYDGLAMYGAWIVYLISCIRETSSTVFKTIYKGFVALASVMILVNLFFRIKTLVELF